jgi:tripartite-type tricarboxylate transporter receptor subunit TctC
LAVAAPERLPQWPEVPTTKELGYPDIALSIWFGAVVRRSTPEAIVKRLNAEITYAMNQERVSKRFELGFQPFAMGDAQFDRFVKAEANKWYSFVKARHITSE